MAGFGPFEPRPMLAVAVSGGADSLALCLLAADWARARRGTVVALCVDHALRPESAVEARQLGHWLAGVAAVRYDVLRWHEPKPSSGRQAAARAARYRLLEGRCAALGCLHLLVAHHRHDQIETVAMRALRAGGPGVAGMARQRFLGQVRILRPLLDVDPARLRATLTSRGQPWIEDPSNRDPAFERVRIRRGLDAPTRRDLIAQARRAARQRRAAEQRLADVAARYVSVHPAGYARLQPGFAGAPGATEVLSAVLRLVGGRPYAPRTAAVAAVLAELAAGRGGRSLAGCLVRANAAGGGLVYRESGRLTARKALFAGATVLWDNRFRLSGAEAPMEVAKLGAAGWRAWRRAHGGATPLPACVAPSLPALWRAEHLLWVPHLESALETLGGMRVLSRPEPGLEMVNYGQIAPVAIRFTPVQPLLAAFFGPEREKGADRLVNPA